MNKIVAFCLGVASALAAAACATTALEPAARHVRMISADEAKACTFVDSVSANNVHSMADDPQQDAKNQAMNMVAARGGNALLIKATDIKPAPSGIGGWFFLSGEAYNCSN